MKDLELLDVKDIKLYDFYEEIEYFQIIKNNIFTI